MEVWGERNGLSREDVLLALRKHMYHEEGATLRFAINEDGAGELVIRVLPKRYGRSRSRSPREPPRGQNPFDRRHSSPPRGQNPFDSRLSRTERRARRVSAIVPAPLPPPSRPAPQASAPSPTREAPPAYAPPVRHLGTADKLDMSLDDLITRDVDLRR